MSQEQTPVQGKDQRSWNLNIILLSMFRSVSPARSPRPEIRDFSLNFSQVGMVAVGAVRLKRKTLPLGIKEWPEEVIQKKLLEVVTSPNVDVEIAVAYMEHLPEGINSAISLETLDKGKRWLQLLLSAPQCIKQWDDRALAGLLQLLGIDQVIFKKRFLKIQLLSIKCVSRRLT